MHIRLSSRSPWFLLGAAVAILCAWMLRAGPGAGAPIAETETAEPEVQTASIPRVDAADGQRAMAETPRAPKPPTFAALLDELVGLGLARLAATDANMTKGLEHRGRAVLECIMTRIADPDSEALHTLTGLMSEDTSDDGRLRRSLCVGIVRRCLERKHTAHTHGSTRTQLDALVHAVLACVPMDEVLARDMVGLLDGQPYLGLAHETVVLDLASLATEDRYLIPLVTSLLETLWKNLERGGVRSARELAQLALLFHKDANPVKRLAALRLLLVAADGRYAELVLQEALAGRDASLAEALTMTAAAEMPPDEALRTLERLSAVSTRPLTAAFMTLGGRKPKALVDAYESRLADDTAAGWRAELVSGAGFRGGPLGLALARTAFSHDPDPEVRARAMLVLTGQGDVIEGTRALDAALSDPAFRTSTLRLTEIVLALENLAPHADGNVVDRVARRLRDQPGLPDAARERLDRVVARYVPGQAGR